MVKMVRIPVYLKKWQQNGLFEETANALRLRFPEKEFDAGTAAAQVAEILHNLGYKKLFMSKMPESRFGIDGFSVYRDILRQAPADLPELAAYSRIYAQFSISEEDKYLYGNDFLNISNFYKKMKAARLKIIPEQFFQTNAMLFQKIEAPAGDYSSKSKVIRGIYGRSQSTPLRDAFCLRFMSAAVADDITDCKTLYALLDGFDNYTRDPGRLNDDFLKGLLRNVIPQAKINPVFSVKENMWGMYPFEYGIGDFNYRAKTSRITPALVNEMLLVSQEFATADFKVFETNRRDGLTLSGTFGALRDCIHDQRCGTDKLIAAMVDYYDTAKDIPEHHRRAKEKLREAIRGLDYNLDDGLLMNLELYDRQLPRHGDEKHSESAISVLRRLRINTVPETDKPPLTNIETVNVLAEEVAQSPFVNGSRLEKYLKTVNDYVEEAMSSRRIGIEPSLLSHLGWTSRITSRFLSDMDYERQVEAYKKPYFKQILRFAELTHNPDRRYDAAGFEAFAQKVAEAPCMEFAYAEVCNRQTGRIMGLMKHYGRIAAYNRKVVSSIYGPGESRNKAYRLIREQRQRRINRLFSGSLLKELQNMSQYKTASCLVGRRHQEEQRRTYPERANFYKLAAQAAGKGLDFTSKHNPEAEVFALRGKAQNNR